MPTSRDRMHLRSHAPCPALQKRGRPKPSAFRQAGHTSTMVNSLTSAAASFSSLAARHGEHHTFRSFVPQRLLVHECSAALPLSHSSRNKKPRNRKSLREPRNFCVLDQAARSNSRASF
eukprot:8100030-Heterocapsa_arctica.AAC.1